mgnify:CR=1 FL=1
MTLEEQLKQINNAISAIECGAQSYKIGSRSLQRADLGILYKERKRIQDEIAISGNYGGVTVAIFDRR